MERINEKYLYAISSLVIILFIILYTDRINITSLYDDSDNIGNDYYVDYDGDMDNYGMEYVTEGYRTREVCDKACQDKRRAENSRDAKNIRRACVIS